MAQELLHVPEEESLDATSLAVLQRRKLDRLLSEIREFNPFYREKLRDTRFDPLADPIDRLPFTTRAEIEQDHAANPPYGTNLTYPLARYCRFHQTSGTGGRPVRWLDTAESWAWWEKCWRIIFTAAGVSAGDRVFFPFSFGPFIGFWGAFESAVSLGCLAIPAGGLSTTARLKMALDNQAGVICCTPTYALHMAEVAATERIDIRNSAVRAIIVAGEPGGNIPATRQRIEAAWGARVHDHSGMTEMGALSFECQPNPGGLHVIESEFIAECIDPQTLQSVPDGEVGELVLTNLGRVGSPLIRYRTRDQVRLVRGRCDCGRCFARLQGGILGRIDDMFIVRGNNVFPTAVEAVLRRFAEVAEFRVTVHGEGALAQVSVEVEPAVPSDGSGQAPPQVDPASLPGRVARALQETLNFRATVTAVVPGALPRFEMKARRFVRVSDGT